MSFLLIRDLSFQNSVNISEMLRVHVKIAEVNAKLALTAP